MKKSEAARVKEFWEALPIGKALEVRMLNLLGEQIEYDLTPFVIVEKCFVPLVVVTLGAEGLADGQLRLFKVIDNDGSLMFRGVSASVWKHRLDPSKYSSYLAGYTIVFADPIFQLHALMDEE